MGFKTSGFKLQLFMSTSGSLPFTVTYSFLYICTLLILFTYNVLKKKNNVWFISLLRPTTKLWKTVHNIQFPAAVSGILVLVVADFHIADLLKIRGCLVLQSSSVV